LTIDQASKYICGVMVGRLSTTFHPKSLPLLLSLLLAGCHSMDLGRLSDPPGYWLPLTVELRLDPSVTEAELSYLDACRQNRALKIGEPLRKALTHKMGLVFERVRPAPAGEAVDGTVEIALGIKDLTRFIPRQAARSYSASVTLGATLTYATAAGEVLYTKSLKTDARRDVSSEEKSCEISGLDALAEEAIHKLAVGLAEHLATSTKVREAAEAKAAGIGPRPAERPSAQPERAPVPPAVGTPPQRDLEQPRKTK
jgi:hypothetical protein